MTFDQLRDIVRTSIDDNACSIIREINRAEIIALAKKSKANTGKYLPKPLKRELQQRFNESEGTIERLVYESETDS